MTRSKAEFVDSITGLSNGGTWVPEYEHDPEFSIFIVTTFVCGGSCDVYWEHDPDGDGTYEFSEQIDSLTQGASTGNEVEVNMKRNTRIRIENTSGGAADFAVSGSLID